MTPGSDAHRGRRWLLGLAALLFLILQLASVSTEGINWDEIGLLHRAERTQATGFLDAGGRPGLVVLALLPWVEGCTDSIALARQVRYVWVGLTLLMLAGLYALVRRASPKGVDAAGAAALAVGVLALAPPFLRWSLQVRTDQPALAAALWGGVLLLASRERRGLAPVAGLPFGLGYLCSQKALYGVALVGLLAGLVTLADLRSKALPLRGLMVREGLRAAGVALGFLAAVAAYRLLVGSTFSLSQGSPVEQGLAAFTYYRERVGFRVYWGMARSLWPQALLLLPLVAATALGLARRRVAPGLAAAGCCLALGLAVGAFHAAAFPYFWLTLGLFPAVALGLGWSTITSLAAPGRPRWVLEAAVGLALLLAALPAALDRLEDSQRAQSESLAFVARNLPPDARGFQTEGALLCRPDPQPLPRLLTSHQIYVNYAAPGTEERQRAFLELFRKRPVTFLVDSLHLRTFGEEMQQFWREHYVPYRWAVQVAGVRWRSRPGAEREVDLVATGTYRLRGLDGAALVVAVDDRPLDSTGEAAPATLALEAGGHRLRGVSGEGLALLTLDLAEPPGETADFYPEAQVREIRGER